MLRKGVLALASLTLLFAGAVQAESGKADATVVAKADKGSDVAQEPAATAATTAEAAPETSSPAATATPESKPEQADAKPKPAPLPDPTLKVSIDLAAQRLTVSEHGQVKYSWPISSGTASHPTPRGTFRPQWTAKMWYSRKYDNAPMPNAVFINGGVAIHATYATGMLGRPASHGCIRLAPANAKTFYNLVHKHGLKLTRVSVYGTPKYGAPVIASRKYAPAPQYAASGSSGWGLFDFGSSSSAYNPNFIKKRNAAAAYKAYPYASGKKVQRISGNQPRRYYYKGYGGYASSW
ncbi:MAG: L,D-transpeptidase [Hyphomicrobium sp.]|nr:L,D-transpeptidase [Hyphomicrobium sp.]